jgi:hypothetical protein
MADEVKVDWEKIEREFRILKMRHDLWGSAKTKAERVSRKLDFGQRADTFMSQCGDELLPAIRDLQEENERLREALKPMADAWHKLQTDGAPHLNADPEKPSHGMGTIKQKHTKRAADLLGTKGAKP